MLTILSYSLFTFLCGLVTNLWQLAILRILCGIGLGGEQPPARPSWPKNCPSTGARWPRAFCIPGATWVFLAGLANYFIGANWGWRWMFFFGGLPALFITFIRWGVKESRLWHEQFGEPHKKRNTMKQAFGSLFTESTSGAPP